MSRTLSPAELRDFVAGIFMRCNTSEANARSVATALVEAELAVVEGVGPGDIVVPIADFQVFALPAGSDDVTGHIGVPFGLEDAAGFVQVNGISRNDPR